MVESRDESSMSDMRRYLVYSFMFKRSVFKPDLAINFSYVGDDIRLAPYVVNLRQARLKIDAFIDKNFFHMTHW